MGRARLEVPNIPISASIPAPLMQRAKSLFSKAPTTTRWQRFVTNIVSAGLEVLEKEHNGARQ